MKAAGALRAELESFERRSTIGSETVSHIKATTLANRRLVVDPAIAADLRRTLQHDPQPE